MLNHDTTKKSLMQHQRKNNLQTLVTSMDENHEGSLKIHQDAIISRIDLDKEREFEYKLKSKNHGVYVMIITGKVKIDNNTLESRDANGVSEAETITIKANQDSSLLFIEVPINI